MSDSRSQSHYKPQLDTLRAMAVLLVLVHHWLPHDSWLNYLPTGPIGVTLFFVLSGYLISGILLTNKQAIKNGTLSEKEVLSAFYIRRSLRIFPLYFIVIFICLHFNVENISSRFGWFVSYCTNIMHFSEGKWMGSLSHLWTLAVEEQYYLFIPFIIVFVPDKFLMKVIWVLILIGPLSRVFLYLFVPTDNPEIVTSVLTISAMDCFGLGTVLAYVRKTKDLAYNEKFDFYLWIGFVVAMVLFLFMVTWGIKDLTMLALRSIFSVISIFIIDQTAKGIQGKAKMVMENRVLLYLGKISYGIYIIHMFMPYLWEKATQTFPDSGLINLLETEFKDLLFFVFLISTIALASFSWFFLEKPINDLKIYFEYKRNNVRTGVPHLYPRLAIGFTAMLILILYPIVQDKNKSMVALNLGPRLFPATATGIYIRDFNKIAKDTSFALPYDIPFHYEVVSLYLAWGVDEDFDLPIKQMQYLEKEGKRIFITWEPWTSTFPNLKIDNKEVYEQILRGTFDKFLERQSLLLLKLKNPVYLRWANNADRLDCPWSAITYKEIQQYKKAHEYMQDFFNKRTPDKIKWVWPAPQAHRMADYLPENYMADYIGIGVVNKGKSLEDENWRQFSQVFKNYKDQIREVDKLKTLPIFLTEVGMEQRSTDEVDWYKNACLEIKETPQISHAVIFTYHKPLLRQLIRSRTKSFMTSN